MDLGALLCTRNDPDCAACPVNSDCQALLANAVSRYPAPKPRTKVSERNVFMLLLQDNQHRVLLEKRPPAGIWGGLWSLPEAATLDDLEQKTGLQLAESRILPQRQHRLSHVLMTIRPVQAGDLRGRQLKCSPEQSWFAFHQYAGLGLPKPVADLLHELNTGEIA